MHGAENIAYASYSNRCVECLNLHNLYAAPSSLVPLLDGYHLYDIQGEDEGLRNPLISLGLQALPSQELGEDAGLSIQGTLSDSCMSTLIDDGR